MANNKFEEMLEHLVNEDREKAEELFHDIVVEKSRKIYEDLLAEETKDEEVDEASKDEEVDEASKDDEVDEASDEEVDEAHKDDKDEDKDKEVKEDFDLDEFEVEADDEADDGATFFGNWLRQTKSVINENSNTNYIRVIAPDNYNPEELNKSKNYSLCKISDFKKIFQLT